jgi:hypothetical protein
MGSSVYCHQTILLIVLSLFLPLLSYQSGAAASREPETQPVSKSDVISKTQKMVFSFTPNQGQVDERVKFYANIFEEG